MEKNEVRKLRLLSNQQMALSDIWPDEFCFPNSVEIEFGPIGENGQSMLKGINLYVDSMGSFDHIREYLGFKVYKYQSMSGNVRLGEVFKLPDYPISIIYQEMPFPGPIAAILSGYPPGYGQ